MQLYVTTNVGLQLFPDTDRQVFGSAYFPFQEVDVQDQAFMIHLLDDFFLNQTAELLGVIQIPRVLSDRFFEGNQMCVMMLVPVEIGTLSQHGQVLFLVPVRVVQFMSLLKLLLARKINHAATL